MHDRLNTHLVLASGAAICLGLGAWGCSSPSSAAGPSGPIVEGGAGLPDAHGPDAAQDAHGRETGSPPPDEGAPEASPGPDAGADACTGTVAVVGGTTAGASTIAFAATRGGAGSWLVSSLPTNVASPPAIVPWGEGFLAVFVDVDGALEFVTSTWSWSSPAAVAGVNAIGSPSLAVVAGAAHLVYEDSDHKYAHGVFSSASGWDAANDPVGGASKQGFGPSAPVAAGVAGALSIAYGGQNGSLYDETWTSGAWQPDSQHAGSSIGSLAPAIVALTAGSSDTLVVYADAAHGDLYATSRAAGVWTSPEPLNVDAFTAAPPALTPLSGGRALLAYLGTDALPYFSVYDPSSSPPWTAPAAIGSGSPKLSSPPSIAAGVCGADAVAVLTAPGGVTALEFTGGSWGPSAVLDATAGMTFASVASRP